VTTADFLSQLRSLNVELWAEGDILRCNAPEEILTPELSKELKDRKAEILAFLREMSGAANSSAPPLRPASRDGDLPLSFAQQRLWFIDQLEPNTALYNITKAFRLKGSLSVAALGKALQTIVSRHEVLRTIFAAVDGLAVQVIASDRPAELKIIDVSRVPGSQLDKKIQRLLTQESARPFNLSSDLMLRGTLLQLGAEEHILLLTMHHIASDGWSWGVLFRELETLYKAFLAGEPSPLSELPVQYADYAIWRRQWLEGQVLEAHLDYWKKQLADAPALDLLTDRPRPAVQTYRGASESFSFSEVAVEELKSLSRREGATLFMTLLAAFSVLLHRYTGQDDIVVGSPVSGRNLVELEDLIGFFVNDLVLRTDLSGDPAFRELLRRVRQTALAAYAHQDLPFDKLVEKLRPKRGSDRHPLFQVMFAVENGAPALLHLAGVETHAITFESDTAKFDLTMTMVDGGDELSATLEYNSDLFDRDTIKRMLTHFQTLLRSIAADPERRLSRLPMLTENERHRLLVVWNTTERDYPAKKYIHEIFESQVERSPDAVAVVFDAKQLTYRELNQRANRLAHELRKRGVGPEVPVGICMERSPEMIVGVLGILKAGGAYVPLDPAYPNERLALMLCDARAPVLLTQKALIEKFPDYHGETLCLDVLSWGMSHECEENPVGGAKPESLAYVMYTSGSTGTPKGVAVPHRAVTRLVINTDYVDLNPSDVVARVSNSSFDAATFEIWGALLNGAKLVGIPTDVILSPEDFAARIDREKITAMFLTTALFNQMARERPSAFKNLHHLLFGGEAADPKSVASVLKSGAPERLLHVYGPTETTTFATWHLVKSVPEGATTIPIGRPIANAQIYLLDRYLQPVPVDAVGEIFIGGLGLARGYLNQPELTAEKFIAHPYSDIPGDRLYRTGDFGRYLPDGNIEFLGRVDQQVKLRGFRIELGEIEAVLSRQPKLREAVVLMRERAQRDKELIAYVVPSQDANPTNAELRTFLQQKLPGYMVPSEFVFLESIPLSPNGKIDRAVLPEPDGSKDSLSKDTEPKDDVERRLITIWEEALARKGIGTRDDFFELGGHSLLAARIFIRLEKDLGVKLPLATLFRTPTIEGLAAIIRNHAGSASWRSLVAIRSTGSRPPIFAVPGVGGNVLCYNDLARHLGAEQPFYGLQSRGLGGTEKPQTNVEDIAAEFLRELREVQAQGPYYLIGACMGGAVAYEMAQQLRAAGEEIALLALLETWLPEKASVKGLPADVRKLAAVQLVGSRLQLYLRTLAGLRGRQRYDYLIDRLKILKQIIAQRDAFRGDRSEYYLKVVEQANLKAFRNYQPRSYDGRLVLFVAEDRNVMSDDDPRLAWSYFASRGVEVYSIPGEDSGLMLTEPHVRQVADQLDACLKNSSAR
jgi:aspartate racemase